MSAPVRHRGIVVGVDGSSASKLAVGWAARDAAMCKVPLTLVTVIDPPMATTVRGFPMPMPPCHLQARQAAGRKTLDDALGTVEDSTKQTGHVEVSGELMSGHPASILVDLSKDAEMVVVGRAEVNRSHIKHLRGLWRNETRCWFEQDRMPNGVEDGREKECQI
jgi:nucleotide-binding universal stress UspA family protein